MTKKDPKLPKDGSAAVHEIASDLHRAGLLSDEQMREFDKLCLRDAERGRQALQRIPEELLARHDAELAKLGEPGIAEKVDQAFAARGRLRKRPKAGPTF